MDLSVVAMRMAQRLRTIVIRERLVPVGKPDDDSPKKTGGELRKSIHVSRSGRGAVVGTNKVYARAVHEGRKALIIRPRRKRLLRWKSGGKYVFARKVFQKKRAGRPFFRTAVDIFERNLDNEIKGLALDRDMAELLAGRIRKQGLRVASN